MRESGLSGSSPNVILDYSIGLLRICTGGPSKRLRRIGDTQIAVLPTCSKDPSSSMPLLLSRIAPLDSPSCLAAGNVGSQCTARSSRGADLCRLMDGHKYCRNIPYSGGPATGAGRRARRARAGDERGYVRADFSARGGGESRWALVGRGRETRMRAAGAALLSGSGRMSGSNFNRNRHIRTGATRQLV